MNKKKIRTILIISATIGFFALLTAIVIIISRGGKITTEGIIETGIMRVAYQPESIKPTFYLNNEERKLTDKKFSNLEPGIYTLTAEAPGYANWEKEIEIKKLMVTDVFVKFYPIEPELEQLTTTPLSKAFFSDDGEYVYYTVTTSTNENENGIWRLPITKVNTIFGSSEVQPQKITNRLTIIQTALSTGAYSIYPSSNNDKIIFHDLDKNQYYIFDATKLNPSAQFDLNALLRFDPEQVLWFNESQSLLIQDQSILLEYDLRNNSSQLITHTQDSSLHYALGEGFLYHLDIPRNQLFLYKNKTNTTVQILDYLTPVSIIEDIYCGSVNEDIIYILDAKGFTVIDLKTKASKVIASSEYKIYKISRNGTNIIMVDELQKYYGFSSEFLAGTNLYSYTFNLLPYNISLQSEAQISFVPQSSHILTLEFNNLKQEISMMEADGENKTLLFSSESQIYMPLSADAQSNYIIFPVEQQNKEVSDNNSINLFRVRLNAAK